MRRCSLPKRKPELPPLLRQRRKPGESPEVATKRFWELLQFFGGMEEAEAFSKYPEGSSEALAYHLALYARLAHGLLAYYVKAYQPTGRPFVTVEDWVAAGGPAGFVNEASPHFYKAQLAQLVHRLEKDHGKGKDWVFRWLANEEAIRGPREAQRRLDMLPSRYRRLRTSGSIKNAYMRIDRAVRQRPEVYLPPKASPLAWALAFGKSIERPMHGR